MVLQKKTKLAPKAVISQVNNVPIRACTCGQVKIEELKVISSSPTFPHSMSERTVPCLKKIN